MTFPELLEAQWSDYSERHRNKANLMIHIVAVPLVWLAAIQVLGGLMLTLIGVGGFKAGAGRGGRVRAVLGQRHGSGETGAVYRHQIR